MKLEEWYLSREKFNIENIIMDYLNRNINKQAATVLEPQIFPSKRIRSFLIYILCKDLFANDDFYKVCSSIEIFHQSTLILDDTIENDPVRDGNRTALHVKFGNNVSGAGKADHLASLLILLSEKILLELNDIKIVEEFTNMKIELFTAQLVDTILIENNNGKYIDWLLYESYKKTSSFMEFPFYIYGYKSGYDENKIKGLKEIGKNIGILYQIANDLSDLEDDVAEGILVLTYPLCYCLDNLEVLLPNEKQLVENIFSKKFINKEDIEPLLSLYKKYEEKINISAKYYLDDLFTKIENLKLDEEKRTEIIELCKKIIAPKYWQR